MNSNRSSNQSQGKAKGKNQPRKDNRSKSMNKSAKRPQQASAAAAYATGQTGQGAQVTASKDSCRVVHREFIGNVTGSEAFAVGGTYPVNPGMVTTFPWLSGIARNWESYRFRRLSFKYYTRTGTAVPGSVLLAHDPDSSDAAPSTEQVMASYRSVREDAPWKDLNLPIPAQDLNDLGPRKFIRSGALAANQDIKLYDSGNLFVGAVDGTAVNWGKLWVEYDVELHTPQLAPTGPIYGGSFQGATSMTAANPMGTAPTSDAQNSAISIDTASTITFDSPGTYLITMKVSGTTITGLTFTAGSGATGGVQNSVYLAAGTSGLAQGYVTVTTGGATLALTATAATISAAEVKIGQSPADSI